MFLGDKNYTKQLCIFRSYKSRTLNLKDGSQVCRSSFKRKAAIGLHTWKWYFELVTMAGQKATAKNKKLNSQEKGVCSHSHKPSNRRDFKISPQIDRKMQSLVKKIGSNIDSPCIRRSRSQFLYFMVSFSNPIVGNCLAYSSTSWRNFAISDWKWDEVCSVAKKSFNFVPALQKCPCPHYNMFSPKKGLFPQPMTWNK